ncbi:MAG: methionyl-tRNA formyltransferase [Sphingomonadaceae bacterium]
MRIIFMGTPDFAVPTLAALEKAGHEIIAVYSQPPRRAGRGKKIRPSPVQAEAERLGLTVYTPESLKNDEARAQFSAHDADIAVVAAYGLILPQAILDAPRHGCLNVHGSLLPRWRGAAPVQRAILAGDTDTGICIMQMEAGLDTGPVLNRKSTPIDHKAAGDLTTELADMGAGLMVETLAHLPDLAPVPQDSSLATYAAKIDKAEARIDWSRSASEIERLVRAFAPSPGAWFELAGERVKLLEAHILDETGTAGMVLDDQLTIGCGDSAIRPLRIQRAGKPAMDVADFLRGRPVPAGMVLE